MKQYQLGEFEEIVLLVIGILDSQAYSVAIKDEIESRLSRTVSMGAMHTALMRLEDKGYVKSFSGETTPERSGRPKRYFEISALGKKALIYVKTSRDQLWSAMPKTVIQMTSN